MKKLRVIVLFGGKSGEHEVSLASAQSVMSALDPERYEVVPVGISREGRWINTSDSMAQLLSSAQARQLAHPSQGNPLQDVTVTPSSRSLVAVPDLSHTQVDVVLPIIHGPYGEDGRLQGMLDMMGIPYVGSGVGGSAVSMDKIYMKALFAQAGIQQLPYIHFTRHEWERDRSAVIARIEALKYPVFVKPANLGSSVGISKVKTLGDLDAAVAEALSHDRRIVVEAGLDRPREIELAVLGNDDPIASIAGEITPDAKHEFYSYESKYTDGGADLQIPAPVSPEMLAELQSMAVRAFKTVDARGLSRVDFLVDRVTGACYLNEINTMPGFTKYSMYPKLWEASGISYSQLLDRLIELAIK